MSKELNQHLEQAEGAQGDLWAVHAKGPDDLYAAFSREDAEKHAAELNALPMPEGISVGAVVIPSPWTPAEHWQYLAEQEREHKDAIEGQRRNLAATLLSQNHELMEARAALAPELEQPGVVDFNPYRRHAEKIRQRVEEAASVYEAGGSALGYMEDIAESALIVRNGLDELSAQHDRIVGALQCQKHEADTALAWATRHYQALEQERDAIQAPELERPEVVEAAVLELEAAGWRNDDPQASVSSVSTMLSRIVGALQAELASTTDASNRYNNLWNSAGNRLALAQVEIRKLTSERDAAQAKLAELEKQEPVAWVTETDPEVTMGRGINWFPKNVAKLPVGTKLYAAPVAQAGQVPKELREAVEWADHLLFECGALVQTRAPSVHVYNKAFAAIEAAKTLLAGAPAQGGE